MSNARQAPGTSAPCDCFAFLELLVDHPDGPFTEIFAHWLSSGGYGVKVGHLLIPWPWCPACGGKLGMYRPELVEAHRRYRAACAGPYAALLRGRQDPADFRAACEQLGATTLSTDSMCSSFLDGSASLSIRLQWDPDHDCWYSHAEFAPDASLLESRFLPDPA